jgi:hypothetical protein
MVSSKYTNYFTYFLTHFWKLEKKGRKKTQEQQQDRKKRSNTNTFISAAIYAELKLTVREKVDSGTGLRPAPNTRIKCV